MRLFRPFLSALMFAGLVLGVAAADSHAGQCVIGAASYIMDDSDMRAGREFGGYHRVYQWNDWTYGGKRFLIGSTYIGGKVWDVTNPDQPLELPNWSPWVGLPYPSTDADALQWDFAMLDGHPYGLAMHGPMGWVAFQVNNPSNPFGINRIEGSGMQFDESDQLGPRRAVLFQAGDAKYAVGAWLNRSNGAVVVTTFDNPGSMVVRSNLSGLDSRIDSGTVLRLEEITGVPYLFGLNGWLFGSQPIFIFNMANPNSPAMAVLSAPERVHDMHVDRSSRRLYLLAATRLYTYSIDNPLSPVQLSVTTLPQQVGSLPDLCGHGDLLAVLNGDLPAEGDFAWGFSAATVPPELAFGNRMGLGQPKYNEINRDLKILPLPNGNYAVYRAGFSVATVTIIDGGCITSEPRPDVAVSGGTAGLTCGQATHPSEGIAARGFPGDAFTLTNASSGQVLNPRVKIDWIGPTAVVPVWQERDFSSPQAWTPEPSAAPGEYHVTVKVQDASGTPYTKVRSIYLCGDPTTILKVDGVACGDACSVLVNATVTLDAGDSQGNPTTYHWLAAGDSWPSTSDSQQITVTQQGANPVGVVVQHGFPAPPHPSCSDPLFSNLVGGLDTYATCARVTINADYATVSFNVEQPSGTVKAAAPGGTGTVQVTQDVVLRYSGQVAAGYERQLTWTVPNFSGCPDGASPCTIPANTLPESDQHQTWSLAVAVRPTGSGEWTQLPAVSAQVKPTLAVDRTLSVTIAGSGTVTGPDLTCVGPATCNATYPEGTQVVLNRSPADGWVFQSWSGDGEDYGLGLRLVVMDSNKNVGASFVQQQTGSPPSAPSPSNPAHGATVPAGAVTFSWSPSVSGTPPISYTARVTAGGMNMGSCQSSSTSCSINLVAGSYSWSVQATNQYGSATSPTRSLTVGSGSSGTAPSAPSLVSPADNATVPAGAVTFSWSPSTSGTPPITYTARVTIMGMNMGSCQSTGTSCSINMTEGSYSWSVQATNQSGNATSSSRTVTVGSSCQETEVPVADFDWSPKGPLYFHGIQQEQPYVGQQVSFTDKSSRNPTEWRWWDFHEGSGVEYTVKNPKHTWTSAGNKNVRMRATNCKGDSDAILKVVTVHPDIRPVFADFDWAPAAAQTGEPVVFTARQGFDQGDPTEFIWDFGPNEPGDSGPVVSREFECRGTYRVKLTVKRGTTTDSINREVMVEGHFCGPESVVAADAANLPGHNDSLWRTDFRVLNSADETIRVWLAALPEGQHNPDPFEMGPFIMPPRETLVLNNVLEVFKAVGRTYNKAAIRIKFESDSQRAPVVIARTYTDDQLGGTFGQFVPGNPVIPQTTPSPLWITGMRGDDVQRMVGFRTSFGIVNPRGTSAHGIVATIYDENGEEVTSRTFNLGPYQYIQHSIHNIFNAPELQEIGAFSMKIEVPAGRDVSAYASVVDNTTNDPVLIPATPLAATPVFLPDVARNPGAAGTVWRTDFHITNPDLESTRQWEVRFYPEGAGSSVGIALELGPGKTLRVEDAVAWVFAGLGLDPPEKVQGMLRFHPVGSNVYPVVAGRTYNVTPIGTFGQNIPALTAQMGAARGGPVEWLAIPGLSSQDIARSNIVFLNLSEDRPVVDFEVYFYGEAGNLLNPGGEPYTYAVRNLGGWHLALLEERFSSFFKQALPANQRAITALIRVRTGGPGFAYASVIDSLTGDPIFIPAQPLP